MTGTFKAACVQLSVGPEPDGNLASTMELVRRARDAGADFILTPEATGFIDPSGKRTRAQIVAEADDPTLAALRALAGETGAWLLIGSLFVRVGADQAANRSYLVAPDGEIAARYDKIHMFDVDIPDGQSYRESSLYRPGEAAVAADLPWGRLGMTVCYDVRFPSLYRGLARAGCDFLSIPAAFTRFTGEAHWQVLVRARAIESGAFVFAPAQCGEHAGKRQTHGHSLIVDPWGRILAEAGAEPGVIVAEIDPAAVVEARDRVPALWNERPYAPAKTDAPVKRAVGS